MNQLSASLSALSPPRPEGSDPGLVLIQGDGKAHFLRRCEPALIGCAEDCDLRIVERGVSPQHARITFSGRGYEIQDLASAKGTRVDGVSVGRALLSPGMQLGIGEVELEVQRVRPSKAKPQARVHRLIGESPELCEIRDQLERLAPLSLPILIRGETGTGKDLAAQTLHEFGERSEAPFVALNCGAIPDGLFESELFGHRRGAFTGAHRDHAGVFARAGRGTVFLDEVAELPISAQAKLLRVLETRKLTPVGGDRELQLECRVVAATHRDLDAMVAAGSFREDLLHRLGVIDIELPPLRRRRADIPPLLAHFVALAQEELGREIVVSRAALAAASAHTWPGNVRALRNAVLRAAALSDGPLSPTALIPRAQRSTPTVSGSGSGSGSGQHLFVERGSYAVMQASMLRQIVAEEGSIRQAAKILEVPRSTLGAWLRRL